MQSFKVKVVQIFRVEREIIIDVMAVSSEAACELVDTGDVDKPDPSVWSDHWALEGEAVEPA